MDYLNTGSNGFAQVGSQDFYQKNKVEMRVHRLFEYFSSHTCGICSDTREIKIKKFLIISKLIETYTFPHIELSLFDTLF
jgi:hypothetical protein